MARNSAKASTHSRVRFIMLDAELGDGDIGQITQAIQNALKSPGASPTKRLIIAPSSGDATGEPPIEEDAPEVDEEEIVEASSASARARGPRKPRPAPNVLPLDMDSSVSLRAFAEGKDAKSHNKKYMVVAAWLKQHRDIAAVTADHIYTGFRFMDWSVGIPDFWQPLRYLKSQKHFTQNAKGEYEINHLGLEYVRKLGGSNGVG